MKKSIIFTLLIIVSTTTYCQIELPSGNSSVKWYTIQEAEKLSAKEKKPYFIDAFTDWCGWCKKMDKDTFSNPIVADILNKKFYPVKFDAEGKDPVTFLGKSFVNDGKAGKAHQLAVALLQGQLSYPTVVFLTHQNDGKIGITPIPGYKEPKEMEMILSFFADKAYETVKWEDFQKGFVGKVK